MSLPPFATPDDLSDWLGSTITNELRAAAVLQAASTLVRAKAGQNYVDENGDLLSDIPDAVKVLTVIASARVWTNPENLKAESIDGYSMEAWERAGLYLLPEELEMLPSGTVGPLSSVKLYSAVPPRRPRWWEECE